MSEQKLKATFDQIRPDEETRQRMFKNILAAYEQEQPRSELGTSSQPPLSHTRPLGKIRVFSPLKYILPIAACLIFAVAIFPIFSIIADASIRLPESSSHLTATSPLSPGENGTASGNPPENVTSIRPNIDFEHHAATDTVAPPQPSNWTDYIPLALSALAIVVALVLTVRGIIAWKQKTRDRDDGAVL